MAFNHVGKCDCPVGCCDCGPTNPHQKQDDMVYKYIQTLIPKDLYMLKSTGELYEKNRYVDRSLGENEFYVGQIDSINLVKGVEIMFAFYGWMFKEGVLKLHNDNGAKYMTSLMRGLRDAGLPYSDLHYHISPLYTKANCYL